MTETEQLRQDVRLDLRSHDEIRLDQQMVHGAGRRCGRRSPKIFDVWSPAARFFRAWWCPVFVVSQSARKLAR